MICRHVYDRHNMIVILSTLVGQGMLTKIEMVNILFSRLIKNKRAAKSMVWMILLMRVKRNGNMCF